MLNKKHYLISALIINTYLLLGCGNEEPHSPGGSSSRGLLINNKEVVTAINSGGPRIVYDSIVFEKDQYSSNGTVSSTPDLIFGTETSELFQTERYGNYSYEIPVSNANYDIRLFFNELFHTVEGGRVFSVTVENRVILDNVDLFATTGHDTAHEVTAKDISVQDDSLTITVTSNIDSGTLSGFAIFSSAGELHKPALPIVKATNPSIWADVPDMSIIRVDDTYYMSSTTMHLNPGVPIMKSTDLINWELIHYAHQALDTNNSTLNMNDGNTYGKGTWASSISHKGGYFYVTSFSYTTGKTYIWKTDNIEGGNWSSYTLDTLYHDSSLILDDDGRNYLAYGSDEVKIIELNEDATAIKPNGVNQTIIQSASAVAGNSFILKAEGTQIQKINGWYYVSNICWPTGKPRTQVLHRSRSITGPYEGRLILQENINGAGVAQGAFINTPDNDWYLYAFRDSGAVGRIPYLVPVIWENDWPISSKVPSILGFDVEDKKVSGIIRSDEFNNSSFDKVWQWNHNPDNSGWSLSERPGHLRIKNTRIDRNIHETRNTLTQRMFGPSSSGAIKLDIKGLKNGDTAGIAAFQDQYGLVGVHRSDDQNYVVMVNNNGKSHSEIDRIPLEQDIVYLKTHGDFINQTDKATFYYSLDGIRWNPIGNTVNMSYELTHFMGYRFALFNFGTQETSGYADFDYFHISE